MRTYCDSAHTFFAFIDAEIDPDLIKARQNYLWNGHIPSVSKKRILLPWHLGGCGLVQDKVRYAALQARLGERIIFDKDMKIHMMVMNKVGEGFDWGLAVMDSRRIPRTGSTLVDKLLSTWQKHTPNAKTEHTVKEIQQWINHKKKLDLPLWTPRGVPQNPLQRLSRDYRVLKCTFPSPFSSPELISPSSHLPGAHLSAS